MFKGLQQKWKVNGWQLLLIIGTFALGGSLCGYLGKKALGLFTIETGVLRVILYILIVTLLWPLCVLAISIPFGQFAFFKKYIAKIGRRMFGKKVDSGQWTVDSGQMTDDSSVGRWAMADGRIESNIELRPTVNHQRPTFKNIAVFASGAGSNAQAIINHFKNSASVKIALIVSNKPDAGVLTIAEKENIPSIIIEKEKFFRGNAYVDELKNAGIDFVVLAGFLWKIPSALIKAYPNKIVNIHPALLPRYGGRGMYGSKVHEAVINNKEAESGITIHYVDELYDHGSIILQAKCEVTEMDTPESLAAKVHVLEHKHYPVIIGEVVDKLKS
jgi:formyltetrahydrofolate-dependent phosphoribosylglycinamide formyltransferase